MRFGLEFSQVIQRLTNEFQEFKNRYISEELQVRSLHKSQVKKQMKSLVIYGYNLTTTLYKTLQIPDGYNLIKMKCQ
ncbi:hypothetical protein Leryth_010586 [Lithospermum erythrorhizon]|nr:hypothetical protein Leryth_010586 [Lithospermum erythrorhizon]